MTGSPFGLLLLTLLGSVAGLMGGIIFLTKNSWAKKLSLYSIPFAAGVLLSVSLIGLIPESTDILGQAGYLFVLSGFLASFIFEKYLVSMRHHEGHNHGKKESTISLVIVGDTIHNFIDGVAIGASFVIDPDLGVVVAFSTFLHEIPHEIGDFGVLLRNGWAKLKIIYSNILSALATIVGAFMVYWVFPNLKHDDLAVLLAITAGMFLYLGATDFLPSLDEKNDTKRSLFIKVIFVLLGVLVVYLSSRLLPDH